MATPDSLFNQLLTGGIGAGVGGLFNIGSSLLGNSAARRAQREQNEFNAEQAQLNRDFQAQQAQIARDWQEEQYNKYSSPSAMVNQYKDAGLNPALMYGANLQSGTGSSPSPSGSAASGSPTQRSFANMAGIISDFLGLAQLKANIDKTQSEADLNYASADNAFAGAANQRSQASLNFRVQQLTKKQIEELDGKIRLMSEQEISERRKQRWYVVDAAIKSSSKKQIDLKNALSDEFEKKFGHKADADTINSLMFMVGQAVGGIASGFGNLTGGLLGLFGRFLGKRKGKSDNLDLDIPFSEVTGNVEP